MNAAPWVVDLPSVASSSTPSTSSTLLSLLRRSTLSSPLLSSPLRLLSARFLHAPRFFSYFPRVSLLSLLSRGVGRPRPLPAFFPLRLDPPLLRPATSYSAFFRFSPISAILVFSADRSARSFASRKFRSETNDDFKIEANRATSSFRIGQENAFLSSPVSVRRGRCVHHPSRKSDSSANRSRFRNHEFRDDIRSPDGLQRRTSNIVRVSFVQDGFAFEKLPARVSNFKLFALRSSSPFVRVRLSLSLSLFLPLPSLPSLPLPRRPARRTCYTVSSFRVLPKHNTFSQCARDITMSVASTSLFAFAMRNAPREWFVVFRFHPSLRRLTRDRPSILRCKLYPTVVARQKPVDSKGDDICEKTMPVRSNVYVPRTYILQTLSRKLVATMLDHESYTFSARPSFANVACKKKKRERETKFANNLQSCYRRREKL